MSESQNIRGVTGFTRFHPVGRAPAGLKPYAPVNTAAQTDLLRARTGLLRLYRQLEALAELTGIDTRFKLDLPDAQSSSTLGLDLTHTAATLTSSDEINASPMSFSSFGPEWGSGSNALITVGGEYDGSHGAGALSFEVRRAGTHGSNDLRIRLEDPQGNRIRNLNIRASHAEDRQYDLRNGLFLTLGPGNLIDRDTASIQIYDDVGAVVDPDRPLGGTRNSNPNLQFGMPAISDGSFQLNGEDISVAVTDSLNDVVNRINQSAAGITATFNTAAEQIEFEQDTLGSIPSIDLQGDTSNFLQATKLDSLNTVAGIDPETIKPLGNVAAFSAVQSGNVIINGAQVSIDTSSDSLDTMIDKINASPAGVVASFDTASQQVLIEARNPSSRLEIDSNSTGFFAALKLPEGRVDPEAIGRGISRQRSYGIADSIESVFSELNYLLRDSSFLDRGENARAFRAPLESAIRAAFGGSMPDAFQGLRFDDSATARQRGDFASLGRKDFTTSLQLRGEALMSVLQGREDNRGLVEGLLTGTQQALLVLGITFGQSGSFIDTRV